MRCIRWLSIAGAVGLLAACANPPQIRSDYDRTADFSRYRSFAFAPVAMPRAESAPYDDWIAERLKEAVQREMAVRGYVYTENNPDLLVNFSSRLRDRLSVESVPEPEDPHLFRRGLYDPWPGYSTSTAAGQQTETLNIDLVDRARKQLVWEGVAVGVTTEEHRDMPAQDLDKVVTQIFTQYPFQVRRT